MIGATAEKKLYDVALTGDATKFREEALKYADYLEEVTFVHSQNVLHIATKRGLALVVDELLKMNPQLARSLDSKNSSPLHIAAAKGNLEITKKLLSVAPEMCWSRDCQNMNPIHIAAMKGNDELLKELLRKDYLPAAMERVHRGQTVLHLCVKHCQLRALKVLVEKLGELVYAKDDDGETIMHLAVRSKHFAIIKYLVEDNIIEKDTPNSAGKTALQILGQSPRRNSNYSEIKSILSTLRADNHGLNGAWWFEASMMTTTVVAMGMMALQATFNPPGGFWQDDSLTHKAGKAVLASTHPILYGCFVCANATTFALCIITMFHIFIGHTFKIPDFNFYIMLVCTVASYFISGLMTIPNVDRLFWIAVKFVVLIVASVLVIIAWNCLRESDGYALVTNTTPASTTLELGATSSRKKKKSKKLV